MIQNKGGLYANAIEILLTLQYKIILSHIPNGEEKMIKKTKALQKATFAKSSWVWQI